MVAVVYPMSRQSHVASGEDSQGKEAQKVRRLNVILYEGNGTLQLVTSTFELFCQVILVLCIALRLRGGG